MIFPALFGGACLAVLALSMLTRRAYGRADAVIMAISLCAAWGVSKGVAALWGWDVAHRLYPLNDAASTALVMALWWARPEVWKLGVGFALLTKLIVHVGFWSWWADKTWAVYNYVLCLNILYAMEIMFVSLPGGWIIANRLISAGPSYRRGHHWSVPNGQGSARSDEGEVR